MTAPNDLTVRTTVRVIGGTKTELINRIGVISRDSSNNKKWAYVHIMKHDGSTSTATHEDTRISIKHLEIVEDKDAVAAASLSNDEETIPKNSDYTVSSEEFHDARMYASADAATSLNVIYHHHKPGKQKLFNITSSNKTATSFAIQGCDNNILTFGGLRVSEMTLSCLSANEEWKCFASRLLGNRLVYAKLPKKDLEMLVKNGCSLLDDDLTMNGIQYKVFSTKLCSDGQEEWQAKRYALRLTCVAVSGMGIAHISPQYELDKIANFGGLESQKLSSRLQLLESPSKSNDLIFCDLSSADDFEVMDATCEEQHDGSGYIPLSYMERFFGKNKVESGKISMLQIRLFAPRLGIFKAVLVPKRNISRIQLPPYKVGPSLVSSTTSEKNDWACLVVTKTWPSKNNEQIARMLDPSIVRKPTKSFTELVEKGRLVPSFMVLRLWRSLGVTKELCLSYMKRACTLDGIKHAWLGGAPDPTGAIPEGHIFIPGMGIEHGKHKVVFLTRSPCAEPSDGVLMPVLTNKPIQMTQEDWDHINRFSFGELLFGPPRKGDLPLAAQTAGGDEDGDLYFTCWDEEVVRSMNTFDRVVYSEADEVSRLPSSERKVSGENWFEETRSVMLETVKNSCS